MRDEVIRIILEAKDKMSGVMRDAERNIDRSTSNISQDLQNLDRNQERYSNNFRRRLASEEGAIRIWSDTLEKKLRSIQNTLSRTRSEFEKTNIAFGKVERGPSGRFESVSQNQQQSRNPSLVATTFQSFKQGLQQAKEIERAVNSVVVKDEKELRQKKIDLEKELTKEQEIRVRKFAEIIRETNAIVIEEQRKALNDRILKEKEAFVNRELIRKQTLQTQKIDPIIEKFDEKRLASEAKQEELIQARKQKFLDDSVKAEKELLKRQEEIRRSDKLSADARRFEQLVLRQEFRQERHERILARDADIREIEIAQGKIRDDNQVARDAAIKEIEAANAIERKKDSDATDRRIEKDKRAVQDNINDLNNSTDRNLRLNKAAFEEEARTRRLNLRTGNELGPLTSALNERDLKNAEQDTNRLATAFRKAGNDFGDMIRGFRRGRSDFRNISREAREGDTIFARFGQTVGRLTKGIGNLVNVRWFALISIIQLLGQLVLVLATNLVSLASSAALAASALGVGLLSAASQLIPVFAILHLAFKRITLAYQASNKASVDATQQAQQQKQAVQALANAKKQAARDIVDAIFAERDAQLSLASANFAVLDAEDQLRKLEQQKKGDKQDINAAKAAIEEAKQRLAVAKNEGDQAQIQAALEQLALAKQNLQDLQGSGSGVTNRQIKEQKLAVEQAKQAQKEAKVQLQRQKADTRQIVRAGVKGNQQVVSAIQALQTATLGSNAAALSKLDPAEKKLAAAFTRLRKVGFSPITDVIVRAFTSLINRLTNVLNDPKFHKAFLGLAKTIGEAITELGKAATSKGAMSAFIGFIHEAIQNIPLLVKAIENIGKAFGGLARAGNPVVRDLLQRFDNLTGNFAGAVNEKVPKKGGGTQTRAQRFITGARPQLDSWIKLADAIGRVFKYLFVDAAPAGKGLVDAMTRMFNNLADFLKNNPEKVNKFFKNMKKDLVEVAGALFPLIKVLFSAFTGPNAAAFTKFTAEVIVPGIAMLLKFITTLTKFALWASKIPGVKLFLQFLVFEKTLNKVFPASQKATDAIKKLTWFMLKLPFSKVAREQVGFFISKILVTASAVAKLAWALTVQAVNGMKVFAKALIATAWQALKTFVAFIVETVIPALVDLGLAMYASLGPWGLIALAIVAVIAGVVLLLRHFHLLKPVIHAIANAFKFVYNWIKDHWKLLIEILGGPFTIVAALAWKFHRQILNVIEDIWRFIKKYGGMILDVLFWPYKEAWHLIKTWGSDLIKWFESLPHKIAHALVSLPGKIFNLFKGLGKKIGHEIFSWVPKKLRGPLEKALGIGKDIFEAVPGVGVVGAIANHLLPATGGIIGQSNIPRGVGPSGSDTVPAWLTPGEWVLNKAQQMKLSQRLGWSKEAIGRYLFGNDGGGGNSLPGVHPIHDPNPAWSVVTQQDNEGNTIYFYKLPNGIYVQTTEKRARYLEAIQRGRKRVHHHAHHIRNHVRRGEFQAFASGGIVPKMYSMGGVITSPQNSYGGSSWSSVGGNTHHKKIEQNFNVNTQGETDWNYVMRLAALHAQESY